MTIRIPKWILAVLGGLVLLCVGIGLGLVIAGEDEGGSVNSGTQADLPCDQRAARAAINDSPLAEELTSSPPYLEDIFDFFKPELVVCRDLNGDGTREMIARLIGQTGSAPLPWTIFEEHERNWEMALSRSLVGAEWELSGSTIKETTPAYADGDATCCPSGKREGIIRWSGDSYSYRPLTGSAERRVPVNNAGASTFAGLDTRTGSEPDAVQVFGVPSLVTSQDITCYAHWSDIGLKMIFSDLGGGDPCGREGSFVVAVLSGTEAEQAGWEIGGLRVGDSVDKMLAAYPEASVGDRRYYSAINGEQPGTPFVLASQESPIGADGEAPLFAALALRDEILALDVHSPVIRD